jgi:hypothetical protein
MSQPDVRLRTYLRTFSTDVLTLMSGALSVPFALAALWVSGRGQRILWACLTTLSVIFASYRVWRTDRIELSGQLEALRSNLENTLAEKDREIAKRDKTIQALTEKPKRSTAEQYHYNVAKDALLRLGPNAGVALRHLRTHGTLTFGTYYPVLPLGVRGDELIMTYIALVTAGLVSQHDGKPGSGERTFAIAPTMISVLDDLLFDSGSPR